MARNVLHKVIRIKFQAKPHITLISFKNLIVLEKKKKKKQAHILGSCINSSG